MGRNVVRLGLLAAAAFGVALEAAQAQKYPDKPVQMIVHFNPGAVVDILGRTFAEEMSQILGQPFVVVNREGAAGVIGNSALAQARPDGYTLSFTPPGSIVIQPHLKKDLPYTLESFAPVCQVFENQFVVLVAPNSRFKTLPEIIDFARANPGKLSWGVFGVASVPHLQFQSLLQAVKAQMTQVPYRSVAQMTTDVSSGQLDLGVTAFGSFGAAPVRVVVALGKQRSALYPDVPSAGEYGYPIGDPAYGGLIAPRGTPAEVLRTLESACAKAAQSEQWKAVLKRTGSPGPYLGSADYAKRLREDSNAKGELVRSLNIKLE
jgi:tripartite-type tricarboxylate transporter receptor subunit TctC